MIIESVHNDIIKKALLLKDKKHRDEQGLFLVEGIKTINEIKNDWEIQQVFILSQETNSIEFEFKSKSQIYEVSQRVIDKLASAKTPQYIAAIVKKKEMKIQQVFEKDGYFVFLENISDPGNLGTIIRCADAFGARGVFVSKGSADIYSDKVLRSTMGSIFHLPVIDNIETKTFLDTIKEFNIKTFAADISGKTKLEDLDLAGKSMILIGNEAKGLTEETIKEADKIFKIPMTGKAQSLNAAIAASIIMYEISKDLKV